MTHHGKFLVRIWRFRPWAGSWWRSEMEREAFFSGYCRQIDGSRVVWVEAEGNSLTDAACCYPDCPYVSNCTIAGQINDFINQ